MLTFARVPNHKVIILVQDLDLELLMILAQPGLFVITVSQISVSVDLTMIMMPSNVMSKGWFLLF